MTPPNLLIITSTYGDGEPPDSAADLYGWLMSDCAPLLEGVSYSVVTDHFKMHHL